MRNPASPHRLLHGLLAVALAATPLVLVSPARADGDLAKLTLREGGSRRGEIEADGDVWVNGSRVGEVETDGDVWLQGSRIGEVESDGDIWFQGSRVGEVEDDGDLWVHGSRVGKVESDGDIWIRGSRWGEADGYRGTRRERHAVAAYVVLIRKFFELKR